MISELEILAAPEETATHITEPWSTGVSTPALLFSIPADDAAQLAREGVPVQVISETRTLLHIMAQIHAAAKTLPECERQARLCAFKWSAQTLKAKYYKVLAAAERQCGLAPWRVLLNKAKAPLARRNNTVLKFAFYEFWRKLGEENQRCWSAAHTELIQIWKTGFGFPRSAKGAKHYTKIPGYNAWPDADPATGIPEGWSQGNLMRYTSDPFATTTARVGRAKASLQRLPVLTSRVGIKFGQYFEFDDHEFNQKVMFQKKPMRPLGFGAIEVLSDCLCHIGMKPTLWDFEEEVKKKLTEKEFMWFVVSHLCTVGYRNDATGTELIVERGTAAIRDAFRERIERVFNGRVSVFQGGRFGRPGHDGQFNGASKGNFKTKKLIESMWNLVDNQMAALPAQTGKDRDHAPEQLHGIEQYTQALIRNAEKMNLPLERRALLETPVAPFFQWREWALDAVARINGKRDHDIEGWEKLGFVVPEWKLDANIRKAVEAMPLEQRNSVLQALVTGNPDLATETRLNRQEVFHLHKRELTCAPFELIPELVGIEHALNGGEPLPVNKGLITFEDAAIDSDPLEFYACDAKHRNNFLPNGDKFICFANPYDPRVLIACEENAGGKLRVVAVCPRYERPRRDDDRAIRLRMGDQNRYEGEARTRLNLRHADTAADIEAMKAHNERVFNGTPITPQEKVTARQEAARAKAIGNYQGDVGELAGEAHRGDTETPSQPGMEDLISQPEPMGNEGEDFSPEGLL